MIKYFTILTCLFFLTPGPAHSQQLSAPTLRAYRLRQLENAIREKMHLPEPNAPGTKESGRESTLSSSTDSNERISATPPESEVHAAINPTDTLNIVTGPMNISPQNGLFFPVYYTTNFGKTWSKSTFTPDPYEPGAAVSGGGDPVFAYDANGKLYMTWIDLYSTGNERDSSGWIIDTSFAGMYWASSTNGGQTWQRATNGYIGHGFYTEAINQSTFQFRLDTNTGLDDKEWIAVDRSNSEFRNSMYVAWTHLGATNNGVMVRRKPPGVDSMLPPVRASADSFAVVQYTSLGVDSKGGLHVTFMGSSDTMNYGIYTIYSSNGGQSFQPAVKISDADVPGQSADAVANDDVIYGIRSNGNYPCPHLSIDTAVTGNLYEVWCALGTTQDNQLGTDIYFSRSTDNGGTWSAPSIINNDRDTESGAYIDHFYPSIAVNGKGTITVTWYDRREDPNDGIGRYYIGQSTDQGQTWTNGPVAVTFMDFAHVMDVNDNFGIGEYTQVVTTPNYAIPFWSDGRDNKGNLRIYAAFLYSNPVVPVAQLSSQASVQRLSSVSNGLELSDNYPNPFQSTTNLSFTVASSTHATLFVTNIAGQTVATIYNGEAEAGEHSLVFDGSPLANGVYYLNLETGLGIVREAMTILR